MRRLSATALPAETVAALYAPLPVGVGIAQVGECGHDELPAPVRLSGATARRGAEYAAGRLAAYRALEAGTGRGHWLERTTSGAPNWPTGIRGSLSHSPTTAICVVLASDAGDRVVPADGAGNGVVWANRANNGTEPTRDTQHSITSASATECPVVSASGAGSIGLDIEPLASATALHRARHLIARPPELALIARSPAHPERAVLRLFSAKEAAYKAAPAVLQPGLSFRRVGLAWDPDSEDPVHLRATHGLPGSLRVTSAILADHAVTTTVWPATPPPHDHPRELPEIPK